MKTNENLSLMPVCAFCLVVALVFALWVGAVQAQSADEELEREAQAIDKMIMCPVCPAETIDQAQVEISFQMRAVIREMLAGGKTRGDILDYFVDRYGEDILAAPPKSGVNLVAWILPVVGVVAGLAVLFLVARSMTGSRGGLGPAAVALGKRRSRNMVPEGPGDAHPTPVEDMELSPYLEIVDRNLASRRGTRPVPEDRVSPHPLGEGGDELEMESRRDG